MAQNKKDSNLVMAGCICLMLAIASYGLSLSTIQGPVLTKLGGIEYFTQITVISSIAICVMTPIGGRLVDMIGGSKLVLIAGGLSIIAGLLLAFIPNLIVFMVCRVVLALAQGAYASIPFILVRLIYPPNETPKAVGYLTMTASIGGLVGSYLAGFFQNHGMTSLALAFPIIPLAFGVFFIYKFLKIPPTIPFKLDWIGIILLTLTLGGILMGLNNAPVIGWFSLSTLISFFVGFGSLFIFVYWEDHAKVPVIPMRMFRQKEYSLLLIIGFLLVFYMNTMSVYLPQAVQDVMDQSTTMSGALQFPRTIPTVLLPAILGVWVVKKTKNVWIALAVSAASITVCFACLIFTGPHMPMWFMLAILTLTGVSDSFRSVSLLPAAQNILSPEDVGVGTSLIGFINTLSGSIASAFFGLAYATLTKETPGLRGMIDGIDTICLMTAFAAFVALIFIVLFFRPMYERRVQEKLKREVNPNVGK